MSFVGYLMLGLGTKKNTVWVENQGKAQEIKGRIAIQVIPTLNGGLIGVRRQVELEGGPTNLNLARPAYLGWPASPAEANPGKARPATPWPGRPALAKGG
jgi:hypothetical protein